MALPANAVSLLRDPDIEHALKQLAKPVLDAAGLPSSRMRILVVNENTMNAFVIDRDHIFIHEGLILRLNTAEELQAVIAHEAAHISNGHLARRPVNARHAQTIAGFGIALAVAAGAASGNSEAGAALGIGISSAAQRSFYGHTRAEESSADSSAIRYMARAGVDPQGAVRLMDMFAGQELLAAGRQDPYARSHPLSRDRLRAMQAAAGSYKSTGSDATANYWFQRAKGKLSAFSRAPKWTLRRAGESGHKDIELMRKAVAYHRSGKPKQALGAVDAIIAASPKDPYLHELKGQFLLERRQYGAAISSYKRAVALAPRDALILGSYGHALLVSGNPKAALPQLERSLERDRHDARTLRDLGGAYAQLGNPAMASLMTSERYAIQGRMKDAGIHAKRAVGLFKRGSPGWQRAQDVLVAAQASEKSRRKK